MLLRLLLLSPVLLVLVVFALSNPQPVRIEFWPFQSSVSWPAALALLGMLGVGVLVGAGLMWFTTIGLRLRARRAERERDALRADLRRPPPTAVAPVVNVLGPPT